MRDRLLNTSEIGELLGIQRTTVTKYIKNGKIKDTIKLGKQYYVSYSSICEQFNLDSNLQISNNKQIITQKFNNNIKPPIGVYSNWS